MSNTEILLLIWAGLVLTTIVEVFLAKRIIRQIREEIAKRDNQ